MSLTETEYAVLRQTIATRGTVRMALLPMTLIGWAAVGGAFGSEPHRLVLSLGVLVAGFEAIHALHVGVERIGRYIQVYYEAAADSPRWETTAMAVGPALPGGGIDPLFTIVFVAATIANLIPAMTVHFTRLELPLLALLHLLFVVRLVRARGAAARQRAVDLETFRAIRSQVARDGRPTV
jgi:hypothetical protein